MDLHHKVRMYHTLDNMAKEVRAKADSLKEQIKEELSEGTHVFGQIQATIQVKDRTKLIDHVLLFDYMEKKGIDPTEYCHLIPDQDSIEILYLEGALDDTDLRAIREPEYSTALITKKVSDV